MTIKNPRELLVDLTKYPAAIEAKLPAGAPKISVTLLDVAGKLPVLPDFLAEIPNPPAPPVFPAGPAGLTKRRTNFVTDVIVTPVQQVREIVPSPAVGVLPEVIQRRGF